jgi:pimeloyl-ACP methyl ester carboxylesterase
MPKRFVLTVGGSYAGELAAWMRMKYPDVVNGALSSSAPLFYRMNLQNLVSNNSYE